MKRNDKRQALFLVMALFLAITFVGCTIGAWWWYHLPGWEPKARGTALSSFEVPDHLDASEFAKRLTEVGFVAVDDADFESLLPQKYRGSDVASGKLASVFKSMKAFRYSGNTDSMTRIVGYDASDRKVLYFRSQVNARENDKEQPVSEITDKIEEELRK